MWEGGRRGLRFTEKQEGPTQEIISLTVRGGPKGVDLRRRRRGPLSIFCLYSERRKQRTEKS